MIEEVCWNTKFWKVYGGCQEQASLNTCKASQRLTLAEFSKYQRVRLLNQYGYKNKYISKEKIKECQNT